MADTGTRILFESLRNRRALAALAALLSATFFAGPAGLAGAQLRAGGVRLDAAEVEALVSQAGLHRDDGEIMTASRSDLPYTGKSILTAKVRDRETGNIIPVYLDQSMGPVDPVRLQEDELAAYNAVNGRRDHRLTQRLATAAADEPIAVAIWLQDVNTTSADHQVQNRGYEIDQRKPVGPNARAARSELIELKRDIYRSHNSPVANVIRGIGGKMDYESELAPLVFARLTPAQIARLENHPRVDRIYEAPVLVRKMASANPAVQNSVLKRPGHMHTGSELTKIGIVDFEEPVDFGNPYLDHLSGQTYRQWDAVEVTNTSGQDAAKLSLTFTGSNVEVSFAIIEPDTAPVCGVETFPSNGTNSSTAVIDWSSNCVDAGAIVGLFLSATSPPSTFSSGFWSNAVGTNIGAVGGATLTKTFAGHPTITAGVASMKKEFGDAAYPAGAADGIAPDVEMLSANSLSGAGADVVSAVEWAITSGVDILNISIGEEVSDLTIDASDRYVDHLVFEHSIAVAVAAGNECSPGACEVVSPGLAYNAITVGAIDDLDTPALGDDVRATYSNWVDLSGDYEKPELSAPGSLIFSTTWGGDIDPAYADTAPEDGINDSNADMNGTSFATPIVSGYIANMIDMDLTLAAWPEATKAIAIASAKRNVYSNAIENFGGAVDWDPQEGAGTIWIDEGHDIIHKGHYDKNVVGPGDFPKTRWVRALAGERFRYAIAWSTHTSGGTHETITNDVLEADLDIYVYDSSDTLVTWSTSLNNAYEVVGFDSPANTNYRVVIRAFRFDAVSESLGEAWNGRDRLSFADGPSLSEWGAILIVLFGMIAATLALRRPEAALAAGGAGAMPGRQPLILDQALLGRLVTLAVLAHVLGCGVARAYFGELAMRDVIGGALTAGAAAYLLHLWLADRKES